MSEATAQTQQVWPRTWWLSLCFTVAMGALGGYWGWEHVRLIQTETARERCVMKRWELSMAKRQAEMFGDDALSRLLHEGQLPPCPNGGVYTLGDPGRPVTCSLESDQGELPRERPAALELYRQLEAQQARELAEAQAAEAAEAAAEAEDDEAWLEVDEEEGV
ncbi:MAG: hypothetical protein ACI4RT_03805 [Candidatus Spyradenecus sp.]